MKLFLLIFMIESICGAQEPGSITELRQRLAGPRAGAHQGGVFGARNTIGQFEKARQDGVDIVEMDLRISKDGIPVVFHDEDLAATSDCYGPVKNLTYSELQNCHLNGIDSPIPSFEAVLQWAQGRIVVDAEFKDSETIAPALELIKKYQAHGYVYFQAQGNREKYALARSLDADVALLFAARNEADMAWSLQLNDSALLVIELDKNDLNPTTIKRFKDANKLITTDVWNLVWHKEAFSAACDIGFEKGVDLAISNQTKKCVEQKPHQ